MGARRLRTTLWRLNALLVVLAAAIWVHAGTRHNSPNHLYRADFGTYEKIESPLRPAVSAERLREFQRIVTVFHRADGAAREVPTRDPQGPFRPPLSAFKVAMFIRDGGADGAHALVLRCKDPAHPETYFLDKERRDRDAKLLAVRFREAHAEFDVCRGDERFTFRTPLRPLACLPLRIAGGAVR